MLILQLFIIFVLHIKILQHIAGMKICVFCSASEPVDLRFTLPTQEFGRWLAASGHTFVFGGVGLGLMDVLARTVSEAGGRTIGVVPRIAARRSSQYNMVEIPCDNLSDRKQLMMDQSEAFVALPGGLGTLDEVFTVAAAATIGYHQRPVILYNMDGFWQPLVQLLSSMQDSGVIRGTWTDYIFLVNSLAELKDKLGN